ncbi:MAG: prepilin-type N-terminal cleavage/methylation domain-containing protein, partial [Planctomycetes bacterium]|nr:prepilin-type N-terminal cleavage/methylation domain-containing protein [Planctomycetota bacterium]
MTATMSDPHPSRRPTASDASGFTLMEVLVTLTLISLMFAMIVPNLGAFVPTARLEGSGKKIQSKINWLRSEARIRGRPLAMELDLDRATWRIVYPPDMRLTLDQDPATLEEWSFDPNHLEDGVVFAGAGDAKNG